MPSTTTAPPTRMLELPVALFLIRRIRDGNLTPAEACATASTLAREARIVEDRPAPLTDGGLDGQLDLDELLAELEAGGRR